MDGLDVILPGAPRHHPAPPGERWSQCATSGPATPNLLPCRLRRARPTNIRRCLLATPSVTGAKAGAAAKVEPWRRLRFPRFFVCLKFGHTRHALARSFRATSDGKRKGGASRHQWTQGSTPQHCKQRVPPGERHDELTGLRVAGVADGKPDKLNSQPPSEKPCSDDHPPLRQSAMASHGKCPPQLQGQQLRQGMDGGTNLHPRFEDHFRLLPEIVPHRASDSETRTRCPAVDVEVGRQLHLGRQKQARTRSGMIGQISHRSAHTGTPFRNRIMATTERPQTC